MPVEVNHFVAEELSEAEWTHPHSDNGVKFDLPNYLVEPFYNFFCA